MDVITKLEKLTDDERRSLEGYLDELNRAWNPERMSALVNHLRSRGPARWHWLAVTEMAKLDIAPVAKWSSSEPGELPGRLSGAGRKKRCLVSSDLDDAPVERPSRIARRPRRHRS